MEYDERLFGEIKKIVTMTILDETYQVPDRLELLRVFQFLDFEIDFSKLCWNGSCNRCLVNCEKGGDQKQGVLSCRLRSAEGMKLTKLPSAIRPPQKSS